MGGLYSRVPYPPAAGAGRDIHTQDCHGRRAEDSGTRGCDMLDIDPSCEGCKVERRTWIVSMYFACRMFRPTEVKTSWEGRKGRWIMECLHGVVST